MLPIRTLVPRNDWMQREGLALSERESMKVVMIAGARPNFVKIGPLLPEMRRREGLKPVLIHTGQHDDSQRSDRFFADLDIDTPAYNLGVGSGSDPVQTADVMERWRSSAEMTSATISAVAP